MLKKLLKAIAILLAVVLVIALGYLAYVFISYHRLPDADAEVEMTGETARTGQRYTIATWNLGFGAYSDDYGFFMDGGTESWAFSKDAVYQNIGLATDKLKALAPDLMILQELDFDATRSYHVDEVQLVKDAFADYQSYFAQNYDSPFLFYPFNQPHGASKAGIFTLSTFGFDRAARRVLPIETGFTKFLDLDRCYSKVWIPVEGGGHLVLYNLHLSAYTSDGTIAQDQLELLCADMLSEYQAGNYVIGGGDFNKDLLGDSAAIFGVPADPSYTWNQPIPEGTIPEGLTLVSSLDEADPIPSNRVADGPYVPGKTFVSTLDGFIVSDNVTVHACRVVDNGFKCSDHNPVVMEFELTEETNS